MPTKLGRQRFATGVSRPTATVCVRVCRHGVRCWLTYPPQSSRRLRQSSPACSALVLRLLHVSRSSDLPSWHAVLPTGLPRQDPVSGALCSGRPAEAAPKEPVSGGRGQFCLTLSPTRQGWSDEDPLPSLPVPSPPPPRTQPHTVTNNKPFSS